MNLDKKQTNMTTTNSFYGFGDQDVFEADTLSKQLFSQSLGYDHGMSSLDARTSEFLGSESPFTVGHLSTIHGSLEDFSPLREASPLLSSPSTSEESPVTVPGVSQYESNVNDMAQLNIDHHQQAAAAHDALLSFKASLVGHGTKDDDKQATKASLNELAQSASAAFPMVRSQSVTLPMRRRAMTVGQAAAAAPYPVQQRPGRAMTISQNGYRFPGALGAISEEGSVPHPSHLLGISAFEPLVTFASQQEDLPGYYPEEHTLARRNSYACSTEISSQPLVGQNGETVFLCPYPGCRKTFSRFYNLKSHQRTHTGEKPYVCDFEGCNAKFGRNHDLKRHKRVHTGDRPYLCHTCGKAFSRLDALNRHLKVSPEIH